MFAATALRFSMSALLFALNMTLQYNPVPCSPVTRYLHTRTDKITGHLCFLTNTNYDNHFYHETYTRYKTQGKSVQLGKTVGNTTQSAKGAFATGSNAKPSAKSKMTTKGCPKRNVWFRNLLVWASQQCNMNVLKNLNVSHRIIDIRIQILNFLVTNIFDIHIRPIFKNEYIIQYLHLANLIRMNIFNIYHAI